MSEGFGEIGKAIFLVDSLLTKEGATTYEDEVLWKICLVDYLKARRFKADYFTFKTGDTEELKLFSESEASFL